MAQFTFDYTGASLPLTGEKKRLGNTRWRLAVGAGLSVCLLFAALLAITLGYRRQNSLLTQQNAVQLLRYDSLLTVKLHTDRQLLRLRLHINEIQSENRKRKPEAAKPSVEF